MPKTPSSYSRSFWLRVAGAVFTAGAVGLAALAAPQVGSAGPTRANAPAYTLSCWQEGRQILSDTSEKGLASLQISETATAAMVLSDGTKRTLVTLGEALCVVDVAKQ